MDEEIIITGTNTRSEKIINFFIKNKKILIITILTIILLLIGYFSFDEIHKRNKVKIANQFNSTIIDYNNTDEKIKIVNDLTALIKKKDQTYSPLALYFLIDNDLISNNENINSLFDVLINKTNLEFEIKNLLIYKKALYNSDFAKENELIQMLNPIINSKSIWKSHALYLMAEFFYFNNEREKAKEFYNQILILSNSNADIKLESQKRLNRDLGE